MKKEIVRIMTTTGLREATAEEVAEHERWLAELREHQEEIREVERQLEARRRRSS